MSDPSSVAALIGAELPIPAAVALAGYAGSGTEQATVDLGGCEQISAPGRSDRQMIQPTADDLRAIAPEPWKQVFRLAGR